MGAPIGNKNAAGPHSGHPHDRGGSSHQNASGDKQAQLAPGPRVTLYHGTEEASVKAILSEGLKSSSSNYGGKVFVSTTKEGALQHIAMRSALGEVKPALLQVSVLKVHMGIFEKDPHQKDALFTKRDIQNFKIKRI